MSVKMIGRQSVKYDEPPVIAARASVAGEKEGNGPLGKLFDEVVADPMAGQNTWEEAESTLQEKVVGHLLNKAKISEKDIRYILSGDLLGQLIASSFGIAKYNIPYFGLFGACSTMGEGMSLGSMLVAGAVLTGLLQLHQVTLRVPRSSSGSRLNTEISVRCQQHGL